MHLQIEWDLFDNLLLVLDQVVTEVLFAGVLSQLGKLGEVNAQLDLVEDVVGSCTGVLSFLSAGLLYYAEGDTLVDSKLTGKFIKLLFEEFRKRHERLIKQ